MPAHLPTDLKIKQERTVFVLLIAFHIAKALRCYTNSHSSDFLSMTFSWCRTGEAEHPQCLGIRTPPLQLSTASL